MIAHSLYGKIVIVSIFIIVPLMVILYTHPETVLKEITANSLTIKLSHTFTSECSADACIYNTSNTQTIINVDQGLDSWVVTGHCVSKVVDTSTGKIECVDTKTFFKIAWNMEEKQIDGDTYVLFLKK